MIIENAKLTEYDRVMAFYYAVIDGFEGMPYHPRWQKDLYPAPDQMKELLEKGEMFIGTEDHEIICAMALNHDCNEAYDSFDWPVKASKDEIYVIHMLATLQKYGKQGKAKEMVKYAIEKARNEKIRAIRLEVVQGNLLANKLYESLGFLKLATVPIYYPDAGWAECGLYELALQEENEMSQEQSGCPEKNEEGFQGKELSTEELDMIFGGIQFFDRKRFNANPNPGGNENDHSKG